MVLLYPLSHSGIIILIKLFFNKGEGVECWIIGMLDEHEYMLLRWLDEREYTLLR